METKVVNPGVVSKDGLVELQCSAQEKVLYGVLNRVPVLFEVKTGQKPKESKDAPVRPAFNLAIVLDRSGSMAGEAFDVRSRKIQPNYLTHLFRMQRRR